MKEPLHMLATEQQNPNTRHIDRKPLEEILRLINQEDQLVPKIIEQCIPEIAKAVIAITDAFTAGGRLLYFGAGTSGRLGILDAAECPPTYGTPPEQIVGIIAGGQQAIQQAVEGAEDDQEAGRMAVEQMKVTALDVVVGISASGRTPYVVGAMKKATEFGCTVVGIANNRNSVMKQVADIMIEAEVGPEAILGSTRMKAGTAQKLILNMLTTSSMILSGKVYDNLMVDMQPSNLKLVDRAKRLIALATGADDQTIKQAYETSGRNIKAAIVMIQSGSHPDQAKALLAQSGGFVEEAIRMARSEV
ncbi:N-acetylmuramic acid 6-phosphate etherase [Paenibacillus yonginensis]|uniref:N-acetylmuramic acid 6-phosphate etherase n=1 Tax=Paenibacillus yonginensis TaxID=1462996 RepID=A0A1B1N2W9_9BACL|nr:N-acetylmuramic acid 6-phosphate etherase [Paenibacillus yonginensis]ANS75749.1 N-acetylmuramic acid 6-phosphate etherase [Paenibacillus yonginensis]